MDKIHLPDLSFFGRHGALSEENILGQTYRVSLTFELDTKPAAQTDDLIKTIDYRQAIDVVEKIITGPSLSLIETIADRVAEALLTALPLAQGVTVKITKPHPPIGIEIPEVTVEIYRQPK
jgi:7,8-dihydroneopterin aldolase/epimerase/oxygenase